MAASIELTGSEFVKHTHKPSFVVSNAIEVNTETECLQESEVNIGSQASDGQERMALFDLPYEIRSLIWSYLFNRSKISFDEEPRLLKRANICNFPDAVTRTSRRLRAETLPLLLSATTLEVATSFDQTKVLPDYYLAAFSQAIVLNAKRFRQSQFLETLPNLRVLELRAIEVWCKFYDEVFLESPQADESMVRLACFNVQRMRKDLGEIILNHRRFAVRLCCQFVVNSLDDETIVSFALTSIEFANICSMRLWTLTQGRSCIRSAGRQ